MSDLTPADRRAANATMLLLEDRPKLQEEYVRIFQAEGWKVHAFSSAAVARQATDVLRSVDVALLDHQLVDEETGTEFGIWLKNQFGDQISTVVYTATPPEEIARIIDGTSCIDRFFTKTTDERWGNDRMRELDALFQKARGRISGPWISPESDPLEDAYEDAWSGLIKASIKRCVAQSLMPVLILGETGTGKERVARMIHESSGLPRAHFRAINCAALTDELVMSELFGHVAFSFTGAARHKIGVILMAAGAKVARKEASGRDYVAWLRENGNVLSLNEADQVYEFNQPQPENPQITGTLFLDEIGDLSREAQAALLRFLDSNGIVPVGYSDEPIRPRLRIVAATNRPEVVGIGRADAFRTDLLWRLAGWIIQMPSLKDRPKDAVAAARRRVNAFNKQQNAALRLSDAAERRLAEMATNSSEPMFSDSSDPLRHGNFRHLNWVVDRACWLLRSQDSAASEISPELIARAAQPVDKNLLAAGGSLSGRAGGDDRNEADLNESSLGIVPKLIKAVCASAAFLAEPRAITDPRRFRAGDGNLEKDQHLAIAVRDLLRHSNHGVHQRQLFTQPDEALSGPITVGLRWNYTCVLAILAASCEKFQKKGYQWESLNSGIFGDSFSREAMKAQYLPDVLNPFKIQTLWGSKPSNGPAAGFVRLLYDYELVGRGDDAIRPEAEVSAFNARKRDTEGPCFFWEGSVAPEDREAAVAYLRHLSLIAEALGLTRP